MTSRFRSPYALTGLACAAAFITMPGWTGQLSAMATGYEDGELPAGCSASDAPTYLPAFERGATWEQVRDQRNKELNAHLDQYDEEFAWFMDNPVGFSGVPFIMFRVFPDIFPDIWPADTWMDDVGYPRRDDPDALLPEGLGWGMGSTPLIDFPGLRNIRMQVVNLSCAGCHLGQVEGPDGDIDLIPFAPSNIVDTSLWRRKIVETVNDPRYTYDAFVEALDSYSTGEIYGGGFGNTAQELLDRTVFKAKGDLILEAIQDRLNDKEARIQGFLGEHVYPGARDLLNSSPGQVEAFGIATVKSIPADVRDLDEDAYLEEISKYLGPEPALVDIMSVWNQSKRVYAQWDGNLTGKLIRNLGAALGVIGDPALVNYENGVLTTRLLQELPAPPYPFDVDVSKYEYGEQIFQSTCIGCHSKGMGEFLPVAEIGTDSGRATGLPTKARELLGEALIASCHDDSNPACQVDPATVLERREDNPGYLAGPLDGLWARAPYLHNGSVPTIHHLLVPSERPTTFRRGNPKYDTELMGFEWREGGVMTYDTHTPGMYNGGHDDPELFFGGIDFGTDHEAREALIEYLKTL